MFLNNHPILALVPARGGSKGIPRKNMSDLLGSPLIAYTLRAALKAKRIDQVWVSSDNTEILLFALSAGALVIERPAEFATDDASAVDVVKHFLSVLPINLRTIDPLIVYLQPTSPLRTAQHIDSALELLLDKMESTLVSVVSLSKSLYKSFRLDTNGKLQSLFDEKLSNERRQDLPPMYIPNGAIYIFKASDFEKRNGFPSNGSIPFIMTELESIDIDTPKDLEKVEHMLKI